VMRSGRYPPPDAVSGATISSNKPTARTRCRVDAIAR
jgi:hypothetical protein